MHLDDHEFPAKVPNDLTPATFLPVVLFNGSRGVGEKIQTGMLKKAGYDLRMTVPFSSSENWFWFLKHEELCVCVEPSWSIFTDKHNVLLWCF